MPTLTIQLPGLPPVDHILRDEMMTIGRMKGNTIALDDASVSVSHAKITRKGADFFLKDLNSTNGTMLNGQSINEARLKDGDQLKFGEVIALYHSQPDFVSSTPGQTPAVVPPPPATAPVAPPPAPVPAAAAPQPVTTFVSKRLVTQASQLAQSANVPPPPPQSSQSSQGSNTSRSRKKKNPWLAPLMVGVPVLVVVAGILIKFFLGSEPAPKPAPNPVPPIAAVPAKSTLSNTPPANTSRPVANTNSRNPAATPAEGKSLADLKRNLKVADPADRRKAAAALHGLGSGAKEALPELRSALSDSDPDVRMWSALALINNKSYDKGAIPVLIQVLQNDNSMLRQVSCLSLALIPYEETDKEVVVAALSNSASKDEDEEVRKAAVSALKIIAPDAVAGGK